MLDFIVDVGGGQGHPVWQPMMDLFGTNNIYLMTPFILAFFYLLVKSTTLFIEKLDDLPRAEEVVLTSLVLGYSLYLVWLLSFARLGIGFIEPFGRRYFLVFIPLLAVSVGLYGTWAERKLKK